MQHSARRKPRYSKTFVAVAAVASSLAASSALAAPVPVPSFATPRQIQTLAASLKHPLYWLGPLPGFSYELTVTPSGRVFIRYLPTGTQVGDQRASFKTVATYPVANATAELQGAAKRLKRPTQAVKRGLAFTGRPPTSVFLAFNGSPYQIEVYTPSAKLTHAAAFGGRLVAIK